MILTPEQMEIVRHRLGVPDAIVDCVMSWQDEGDWEPEDIQSAIDVLIAKEVIDTDDLSLCELEVLNNCVSHSTFFAALNGGERLGFEIDAKDATKWRKAGKGLADFFHTDISGL